MDWEVLGYCQYEILDRHNEAHDCGEPATHKVWWKDEDSMLVCLEHFKFMKKMESQEEAICAQPASE